MKRKECRATELRVGRGLTEQRSRIAVGLIYDDATMDAPEVAAIGHESVAREITRSAHRYGIPLIENDLLAGQLSELPAESRIPERLYSPVAKVLRVLQKTR